MDGRRLADRSARSYWPILLVAVYLAVLDVALLGFWLTLAAGAAPPAPVLATPWALTAQLLLLFLPAAAGAAGLLRLRPWAPWPALVAAAAVEGMAVLLFGQGALGTGALALLLLLNLAVLLALAGHRELFAARAEATL